MDEKRMEDAPGGYNDAAEEFAAERDALKADNERMQKALEASVGFLLNAKIDLETGCPKATAIRTIEGGLSFVRAALSPKEPTP